MATSCQSVRTEFRLENFLFNFRDRTCFSTPQWSSIPLSWFVVYRAAVTTLLIGWPLADLLTEARRFYGDNYTLWFLFATNWSLLLLVFCASMQTLAAAIQLYRALKPSDEDISPLTVAIYGFVYISSANSAVVVSLTYWIYVFYADEGTDFFLTPMSQMKHTLNTVYIVADLLICSIPIRLLHFIYPFLLGALYTAFNVTYFINDGMGPEGGNYSYREMDWQQNPLQAMLFTACVFSFVFIAQTFLYLVFQLRLWLARLFGCSTGSSEDAASETSSPVNSKASFAGTEDYEKQHGGDLDERLPMTVADVKVVMQCDEHSSLTSVKFTSGDV